MSKPFFAYVMSLFTFLLLTGCAGEGDHVKIEAPMPSATLSPTQTTLLRSPTETAEATITSTTGSEPINTPMLEPSATVIPTKLVMFQPNATTSSLICNQVKSHISIQQETNNESWRLMDFVFEEDGDDEIIFLMWSKRPYLGPTPTPRAGPPTELSQSHRVLLKGQTWNFNSGELVESPVSEQSAIQNPCEKDCPLEVVGTFRYRYNASAMARFAWA